VENNFFGVLENGYKCRNQNKHLNMFIDLLGDISFTCYWKSKYKENILVSIKYRYVLTNNIYS